MGSIGEMAVVGEPLGWMVGTEARRVETEDANDARLESFRLREIPERFLPCRPVSMHFERRKRGLGIGCATMCGHVTNWVSDRGCQITNTDGDSLCERILPGGGGGVDALITN